MKKSFTTDELIAMDLDELLALIYEVDKETSTVAIDIPRQKLERLWMEHVMERLVNDENAYEIGKSGFRGMNDRSDIMLFTDIKLNVPEDELRDVLGEPSNDRKFGI